MAKGLPKSIIKKYGISKKAWEVYRGRKTSKSRGKPKTKKIKRRGYRTAKRKRRRGRSLTIPVAPIIGLAAGLDSTIKELMAGNVDGAIHQAAWRYTGYSTQDGSWDLTRMQSGLLPLILGALVHKFVGGRPLNVNQMLARAGVPFIRI